MFTKRIFKLLFTSIIAAAAAVSQPTLARHGDVTVLPNRIPEPAPYVVSESNPPGAPAGAYKPPFDWAATENDSGRCNGCHSVIFNHWNGAMMSNAWRDPGWRGAFLLVARATSTDGCADIPQTSAGLAADGSQGYDCQPDPNNPGYLRSLNPFAKTFNSSEFKLGGTQTKVTYGSGSLHDDFCSRCHMPTDYVDAAATTVTTENGLEHADISPTFDPTEINLANPTLTDPAYPTGYPYAVANSAYSATPKNFPYESYDTRANGLQALNGRTPTSNTNSGKAGITCLSCHTNVETKYTPYNNYVKSGTEYYPVNSTSPRLTALPINQQDMVMAPDATKPNLGYGIGAGAFRVSPHAINHKERFGPIAANPISPTTDTYLTQVFDTTVSYNVIQATGTHDKFYHVKFERSEHCAACHDVTNPITVKNPYGYWAGGFPIERTFSEWLGSRYAKRAGSPTNTYTANGAWERDCQSCHMQQTFGQAGTALTLFNASGVSKPPLTGPSHDSISRTPHWTHHFVGGNAYMTKMIGADVDGAGRVLAYPELLNTSFSSADKNSRLHYARFTKVGVGEASITTGAGQTQHERFAWDRLRFAVNLSFKVNGTDSATPVSVAKPNSGETVLPLDISVVNDGAGHNFPTGFPEGRAGWVKITAWDTRGGTITDPYQDPTAELQIETKLTTLDGRSITSRSYGVGYLTNQYVDRDPNFATACHIEDVELPVGSIDPYAMQFKAVATLDRMCPTLKLPYATAVNLRVNANGEPVDASGLVVDQANPLRKPAYDDLDRDGEVFDDAYLMDTRLRPQPNAGATASIKSRGNTKKYYSIVVPATLNGQPIQGPIAVSTAVYYQSFEAKVAREFLGNLANTDDDLYPASYVEGTPKGAILEPCVLKAPCDRTATSSELRKALLFDPIVVEGAPPVPMEVKNSIINFTGATDNVNPQIVVNNSSTNTNMAAPVPANRHWSPSPYNGEPNVDHRRVIKVTFTEPVKGVNDKTFYLTDTQGRALTIAAVDQIDDTTWALFPYEYEDNGANLGRAFLSNTTYVAHVAPTRTVSGVTYQIIDLNVKQPLPDTAANECTLT